MKRSIIAIVFVCFIALCSCSNAETKTEVNTSTTTVTQTTTTTKTTTTTEQTTVPEEEVTTTHTTTTEPETTITAEQTTSKSEEGLIAEFMQNNGLTQDDLILDRPDDMEWLDYMLFCRYMKLNGITNGYFTNDSNNPNSSMAFIPSLLFFDDYPGIAVKRDVYRLCTLDSVKDISQRRYEELSPMIYVDWFAIRATTDDEDVDINNPGFSEDGKYFVIAWHNEDFQYVNYWLVIDE